MQEEVPLCPYVGLRPFRESDQEFFFGRERDIRVICSNLQSQALTVLYGPSGVGKSSVLQAGVYSHLKAAASGAAVYFNEWQSPSFLNDLIGKCRCAISPETAQSPIRLDDLFEQSGRRFYLLLDQFEEFLLYHSEDNNAQFDAILACIVNRDDVSAKVLIGIREDALSKLDQRLSMRIPHLLGNTLAVEHLDAAAARDAIRRPLAVLNERSPNASEQYEIEPELIEEILQQVHAGQIRTSESTGLGLTSRTTGNRIETVFLQLVLTRLWTEELQANSHILRLETLSNIGGASSIVQKHVDAVMAQFSSDHERDIAAAMFRYLVTPSRTKIAQVTGDLVSYAEASQEDVQNVLSTLSDRPEARILRRLANPERYEIFHDVLAQPILDWRREHLLQKERAAEEAQRTVEAERQRRDLEQARELAIAERRRAEAEAHAARRLRWMLAAVAIALLLAIGTAIYAFNQRHQAREFAASAEDQQNRALQARADAVAAQKQAEADRAVAQAARAELLGKTTEAERLRQEAKGLEEQARTAQVQVRLAEQETQKTKDQSAQAVEGRDKNYRDALQKIDELTKQLTASETQRRQLQVDLGLAQSRLDSLQKAANPAPRTENTFPSNSAAKKSGPAAESASINKSAEPSKGSPHIIFSGYGFDPLSGKTRGSLVQSVVLDVGNNTVIEIRDGNLLFKTDSVPGLPRTGSPTRTGSCRGISVTTGKTRCFDQAGAQIANCRYVKVTGAQPSTLVTLYTYDRNGPQTFNATNFESELKNLCQVRR